MLSLNEGRKATEFARVIIESKVNEQPLQSSQHPPIFKEKRGVFVTLLTYPKHELRGCIGIPYPIMKLEDALVEAARSSTRDPRFLPLKPGELTSVIVEVTVLTKPELISVNNPKEYLKKIRIGRDGLIINYSGRSGLLLPQVPVEQGWDVEEFLTNLCWKAGLLPDSWFEEDAEIHKFLGQIFTETSPKGKIKEKVLDDI
jgi:uncharacterized protein (TIGR00296 family)